MNQNRMMYIIGIGIAVLLAAILVVGIVILNTLNAQRSQDNYEACMARYGFSADEQPRVHPDDEDAWIDAIAAASEKCGHLR